VPNLKKPSIKLRKITIKNFKAIDSLELEFPAPLMNGEPDVFVMGSKNGIGKTSVLESCALLLLGTLWGHEPFYIVQDFSEDMNIFDLLVRSGKDKAIITGEFLISGKEIDAKIEIGRSGKILISGNTKLLQKLQKDILFLRKELYLGENRREMLGRFWEPFLGMSSDPMLTPPLLYCHSFRKVATGNPELGMMVEDESIKRRRGRMSWTEEPISSFKLEILKSMMGQASLFEKIDVKETKNSLAKLNFLLKEFAGGVIDKLRASKDNTVDVRITNLEGNHSFTFDGLSSGQKEIISTLYLIWKYTRQIPGIVLIDEPELHLNYEWHSRFIRQLHELAPDNQYIIATHSEKVFESAPAEKRVLLEPGNQPKRRKAKKTVTKAR
jgi:predicted ATP-dependent endonuclease of OLD family